MRRHFAAILAADVVGASRLMDEYEMGTLERLKSLCKVLVQPKITERKGRIVKLMGNGLLSEQPQIWSATASAPSRRYYDRSG
jgi:class 3 adenylate cyclase